MKKRFNRRRFLELSAGAAVTATGLASVPVYAQSATAASIIIDGKGSGRVFDGIGAISGGGGNSRLLIDYPEPYRSQILDYLFKPNYGANLHILKVEVGGDTNSTDGSESSFMHTPTDQNFNRGYEWWLMKEAKARNPQIKLYGLAWGAPGWIGTTGKPVYDTNNRFWSEDMVDYYIAWIEGAREQHGLTIDYIGGWNERGYNELFYEAFHNAIQSHGLSTKIVGADSDWSVADAMVSDSTFNASIDIVGVHYPCTGGDGGSATSCPNTSNAKSLGKPLWASENGSQDQNSGAIPMARAINRGYIDGDMTAYINWPLIAAIYPNLPYSTVGLMVASQPWSGNYSVGKQLWVTAHTTQFTQPGWQYIDSACGYLGGSDSNGSYVTLKAAKGYDYSVIIETVDASASQTVTFQVNAGLSTGTVHIWSTNLNSASASDYFVQQKDITPTLGSYSVTLQPGYVYTLSTTTGQGKGTIVGPPPAILGLPYADNFQNYAIGREPRYFSDQNGAFEIVAASDELRGKVMRQMAPTAPINWDNSSDPYTLLGDLNWADYTVTSDVLLEQSGYVEIMGRVGTQAGFSPASINAYYLRVTDGGSWSILKNTTARTVTTLASGAVAALGTNTWHTLALTCLGSSITAKINGVTVGSVTDNSYSSGQVGVGVSGWQNAQFDNFSVTPGETTVPGAAYKLVNRKSGLVLDVSGSSTSNGGLIVQSTDNGAASQMWQLVAAGDGYVTVRNYHSNLLLDIPSDTGDTQLEQQSNDGSRNQQWQFVDAGSGYYTIVNHQNHLCVEATSGAMVIQSPDTGAADQQWQLSVVPTTGVTYTLYNRNSGMVMDVSGQSTSNGGIVIQWPLNGGANQQWQLIDAGGGYFNLVNANSRLVLDVPNNATNEGVQLDQWSSNGGANQQWLFTAVGNGYYTITGKQSGLLVAVGAASTTEGTQLVQWSSDNGPEQQWSLAPVF
ncbi:galactosylceramidase [Ktedonobacteria bacterium brp13]|nr:galactosylceramidase [Ktedonobacteria bacterium brp13]